MATSPHGRFVQLLISPHARVVKSATNWIWSLTGTKNVKKTKKAKKEEKTGLGCLRPVSPERLRVVQ